MAKKYNPLTGNYEEDFNNFKLTAPTLESAVESLYGGKKKSTLDTLSGLADPYGKSKPTD